MKYIITEQQHNKLKELIIDWFEKNLIPSDGWQPKEEYINELGDGGELFIYLRENNSGDDEHIWYSECDNPNLDGPLPKGHCPVVTIPDSAYDALDAYFRDMWKPLFKKWFKSKTGLNAVQVDTI